MRVWELREDGTVWGNNLKYAVVKKDNTIWKNDKKIAYIENGIFKDKYPRPDFGYIQNDQIYNNEDVIIGLVNDQNHIVFFDDGNEVVDGLIPDSLFGSYENSIHAGAAILVLKEYIFSE